MLNPSASRPRKSSGSRKYSALKRNYLPADYRRDASGFEIVGSVFIETEWDPSDPAGEVNWVESVKRQEGLPTVMVAQAWILYSRGEYVDAARILRSVIARKRDTEGAYYLLLRCLFASGQHQEVAAIAEEAI